VTAHPVATVEALWRYPVKSMAGERLEEADVTPTGIVGDRMLAVVDVVTARVLSAKRVPQLLEATATYLGGEGDLVRVEGPGFDFTTDDPDANATLSSWLGRPVILEWPVEGARAVFELEVDPDDPSEVIDLLTPPGSFFDSRSVLHVVSDAAIADARRHHPEGDWDVRRFRPNLLLRSAGPCEDEWVGRRLGIGSLEASVRKRTARCVLTTRPQPGLPKDAEVFRSLLRERDGNLGVYVDPVNAPQRIAVGDAVVLAPSDGIVTGGQ
jgi:uncharacterized protein YcbX